MKIKRENIATLLLLLIGIFCQTQPLMSRKFSVIYIGICLFLFLISINIKETNFGIGFLWYFLFTLFCIFTLLYTINKINPDFVYRRIITYLILLFITLPFLKNEGNFKTIIKGFIYGGLIGITIVLVQQYNLIGVSRLGVGIYGSAAEFGNVCMLALASYIWLKKSIIKNKSIRLIILLYFTLAIAVSGARKAILVPMLMLLFLQLFDKRKKIAKKFIFISIISVVLLLIIYESLNNQYLYKFIGYRIESGISSVLGEESKDASLYERSSFKKIGKEMILEKPIFGWGIHGFALKNYYYHNGNINFLLYSHDGFIEILSCYGILGFILFYWAFAYVMFNYKKLLHDDIGIFIFSYTIIILLMEPYSIAYLNSYYILIIGAGLNIINQRRKNNELSTKQIT